jgi:predicted transcriptional regulator
MLGQAVREFVERAFGGSPEALVMSLVKTNQVDLKKIAKLSRELEAEEKADE